MKQNGPIFADFMKELMNGATPATRELMKELMNGIFSFSFFYAIFPLLYRAWARSSDVSSSSAHCGVEVMPLYTAKNAQ